MGEVARYTYTDGSRAEGCVVYADGKMHVHHDSCPARGQVNAYDLVRLMRYGHLDKDVPPGTPITERPSSREMHRFAMSLPEVTAQLVADVDFDEVPLTPEELTGTPEEVLELWSQSPAELISNASEPRWLIPDVLERAVIAALVGPRGSYKSFVSLMWAVMVALQDQWVYVISAEGADYDRRLKAYMRTFHPDKKIEDLKLRVAQRRVDLTDAQNLHRLRQECAHLKIKPVLFIFDTYSKLTGSLDENSNTDVKAWLGLLDRGIKRADTAFDATVLLVAHVGHADATRARGASAFSADTDAEYIIKRDDRSGLVSVSRERFKSSGELEPLCFKPEVVDLGYSDSHGKPVTSIVLHLVKEADKPAAREPRGQAQRRVWEILQEMCAGGAEVRSAAVIQRAVEAQAAPEGEARDRRRELSRKALDGLVAEGFAYYGSEGTRVSISRTRAIAEDEFDDLGLGI